MEIILSKLAKIPQDKLAHCVGGSIIFVLMHLFLSNLWAITIVIIVAALKEFYDSFNPDKHTVDALDFIATVCGGAIGLIGTFKVL